MSYDVSPHDRRHQQLGDVVALLVELGADTNAAEHDPAGVLRALLPTRAEPVAPTPVDVQRTQPPHYGPGERVDATRLRAGSTIRRYVEPVRGGKLDVPLPCCARSVRVTADTENIGIVACTTSCRLTYDAVLVNEGDDAGEGEHSYAAVFTVRSEPITLARLYPRR